MWVAICILTGIFSAMLAYIIKHIQDSRYIEELEDLLDDYRTDNDWLNEVNKGLMNDNKRMLATLNHYNIKKILKYIPSDNISDDEEIYFGGKNI